MEQFEQIKKLLDNSQFYYIITTAMDGNYSYVNGNYARAFSHIDADMVGKPYYITMHPDDMKVCEQTAAKCFASPDRSFPATIRKHNGKGGYINTQWEYRAMFDEHGAPAGLFCLGYDITKYVAANEQLEVAISQIKHKNDMLEQIGWEQSHIIRKPLANIIGLVGILSKMDLDQNMTNICKMLLQSAAELDDAIYGIVQKTN
ncbi:PAS domain-containing protein [Mucilaginibacter myungsuensis]|uniref:PAS domain-containing protein n=1 Tax=Mucilaginibacter myungsuensis TaxID=649104 RepID=A0A929KZD9_9SPHI|nr:PAS domain-containing protein [Mucilaginibacter myungsuensis]MBE9662753.1 PAS domain-containing protein [Mucilaginibacter myungsuensis]MDN3598173.1 PAS domain-containing protein [Mucilaginibacter myungsuensis]